MPSPHLLKLVMHWRGFGEEGTLSWHFVGNDGSHSPSELSDAAGNAVHMWETVRTPSSKTGMQGMLLQAQAVDHVTLYEYDVSGGPATALGVHAVTGWQGTQIPIGGPLQTCLVASTHTALAGASYRGRQYFPGSGLQLSAADALYSAGAVNPVATLAANLGPEAAEGISGSLSISTLEWCVYSPTKDVSTVITSISVDNKADTQRRREAQLAATYTQTLTV